ncbi:Brp/Blh family beta-carotene 15,15'-dioxygenase [Parvularcula dongshanensis]|uniref:Probable beta-carotene 15,15'-dioxygenase n=1 Tax=Parvularcula dongshanensis TaxID=1173995 RepID=A0A840I458_9PROT|nr:Brp/Blh family beta-carotene 15,15'-dioxygenase [Parvularcula dongshanensis]MBB4659557.1 Brp/Blh family beta-carotene 15,15'-monooxygenase [Parvularcula dongshanensis]
MGAASPRHTLAFLAAAIALCGLWAAFGGAAVHGPTVLILTALVLVLGLPHGALDLWLARRAGLWSGSGGFVRFHAAYLALAASVVSAFLLVPTAALIGFLGLSVWHFSDDWRELAPAIRVPLASSIVLVPCLSHPSEAGAIFAAVTGSAVIPAVMPPLTVTVGAAFLALVLLVAARRNPASAIEAATVVLLGVVLPPLVFFAAYFVLLHGPRHMLRHRSLLGGRASRFGVLFYTAAALLIVLGLGLALGRAAPVSLADETLRTLFVGLAALSVPHAFLIEHERHVAPSGQPVRFARAA